MPDTVREAKVETVTERSRGQRLADWIARALEDLGVEAASTWAAEHGIDKAQLGRWKSGEHMPTFAKMEAWADALGVVVAELLIGGGYWTAPQAWKPPVFEPPNIDAAIAHDPTLTDGERAALRQVLDLSRQHRNKPVTKRQKSRDRS